jgi:hypothetical protein
MTKDIQIILSNGGIIVKPEEKNKDFKFLNIKFNYGFVSSAVGSMVADIPDHAEVTKDVSKISLINDKKKISQTLSNFIITHSIDNNFDNINQFLKMFDKKANGYRIQIDEFKINNLKKCGIILEKSVIKDFRFMNINDTHIQLCSRDYLGFYLEMNVNGKIDLYFNNKNIGEQIKFLFLRIPLLSMKSENAFKNDTSKNICVSMLKNFSKKDNIEVKFV